MQASQDPRHIEEAQPSLEASNGFHGDHQNDSPFEAPKKVSGLASNASSNGIEASQGDIDLVQNLIKQCLQLYLNREEVVHMLSNHDGIEPEFTTLVWKKLVEENSDFFRAYYIRLELKRQIILFNHLLEHQYYLMNHPVQPPIPLAPIQNGFRPMSANSPMGHPILSQHPMSATDQPFADPMGSSSTDGTTTTKVAHATPPCGAVSFMSEMAMSSASATSSNHFPFTPEISGIGMDSSALNSTFPSDAANSDEPEQSRDTMLSLAQFGNISLSEVTADLTNLAVEERFADVDNAWTILSPIG